jgi:hypothetical protein
MMKRATLILVALVFGGVGQVRAGLVMSTVDVSFYYPNLNTLYDDFGQQVVNPTATFSLYGGETTTIYNTQIVYTGPSAPGQYQTQSFNGYVYDFINSGNLISSVTIDPATTISGFNSSEVTLASDGHGGQLVELNLDGNFYGPSATAVLDISTASVPEPSSFVLLGMVGVIGFVAYRFRRRKPIASAV